MLRARLTMKLISALVMLVVVVLSARSCSVSSPSPISTIGRSGLAGLCANAQAAEEASGDAPSATLPGLGQVQASDPAGAAALHAVLGGSPACATTTVP